MCLKKGFGVLPHYGRTVIYFSSGFIPEVKIISGYQKEYIIKQLNYMLYCYGPGTQNMDEKTDSRHFLKISEKWVRIVSKIDANERSPRDFGTGDLLHCSEIHIVMAIGKNPGINITGLSEILGISKSAISQMANRLEGKNLIEKFHDEGNKKDKRLRLTPTGHIAYIGHEHYHAKIYAAMYKKLGSLESSEYSLILRFLSAIEETFDEFEKKGY